MTPEQKKAAARDLLNNPVVLLLLREMEQDAMDQIISADPKDDTTRAAFAGEVRAIRNFRDNLNLCIEEGNVSGTRAPA